MKILIYDCEIINCIPSKNKRLNSTFRYCKGWRDFKNMGISVIGAYLSEDFTYLQGLNSFTNPIDSIPHHFPSFQQVLAQKPKIIGFNSRSFDDNLVKANGIKIKTDYDLLELCRLSGYGSTRWEDQPSGWSYSLDAIAKANGVAKTGSGSLAPQLWQIGKRQEVIDYCLNDVEITRKIWELGLEGKLIDPNTGNFIQFNVEV